MYSIFQGDGFTALRRFDTDASFADCAGLEFAEIEPVKDTDTAPVATAPTAFAGAGQAGNGTVDAGALGEGKGTHPPRPWLDRCFGVV